MFSEYLFENVNRHHIIREKKIIAPIGLGKLALVFFKQFLNWSVIYITLIRRNII